MSFSTILFLFNEKTKNFQALAMKDGILLDKIPSFIANA